MGQKGDGSMEKYYLAVDIGASSGRLILGSLQGDRIVLEEVHRFENRLVREDGVLCWEVERLWEEILAGMEKCRVQGKAPVSMGVDTWAVDYVLLDRDGRTVGCTAAYRDSRTRGTDETVERIIPAGELYRRTGIQKQPFNTIYQLASVQRDHPEWLERAERLLMIPDYFHYRLTGEAANEYTNATTTQLVDAVSGGWDEGLIRALGFPRRIFGRICPPGFCLGELSPQVRERVGFSCRVVLPATHDTGSAVLAVPAEEESFLYLSSGTWSLMGTELREPDCSAESRRLNFTNEGGYGRRFRYLKNIMGLWMIQSVRREMNGLPGFAELARLAEAEEAFPARIDVDDGSFLAPESMTEAVKSFCRRTGQPVPQSHGQVLSCIYRGLAEQYRRTAQELEGRMKGTCRRLYIVGGGSRDEYLNRLTARATGKEVLTGPSEATAAGNILAQMLRDGAFSSVEEARAAVKRSFPVKRVPEEKTGGTTHA
jgi:rhamnulokinase